MVAVAFFMVSLGVGRWMLVSAADLARDPFNPRVLALADGPRGSIVARDGSPLAAGARRGTVALRDYPEPSLAQLVGYASSRYGLAGLERSYQDVLTGGGTDDPLSLLRARYLGERPPPGSLVTSVDLAAQRAAATALGGRTGALVALDPRSGAILAYVSAPAFDAKALGDPARAAAAWSAALADRGLPLLDRVAQGLYPPGSVFKIVTAAAGLESGRLNPSAKVRVDDPFQADPSWGTYAVRSSTAAHGDFDLATAMARSENIYFAKAALAVGPETLAATARSFGVGRPPGFDVSVARGQLSRSSALDRPTLLADTGFGQGELLVSPLQMAQVAATVANGGVQVAPHAAAALRDAAGRTLRTVDGGPGLRVITAATARTLRDALVEAVNAPGAFASGARVPGLAVAGKTGTAENPSGPAHGWFVGFAPAEAPTVAIAVLIEHAPRGGEDAAPVAAAVLRVLLTR